MILGFLKYKYRKHLIFAVLILLIQVNLNFEKIKVRIIKITIKSEFHNDANNII